jgi:hypothetical protein
VSGLDDLHDFADKCTFAFDRTDMHVGLMQTVLGTLGISNPAFGEDGTVIQVKKFTGLHGESCHARVVEEK